MKIQIIFIGYQIPFMIHIDFDIDICKCFYDGKSVFTVCPESHIRYMRFYVNKERNQEINEETKDRIKKYEDRGFRLTEFID